MTAADTIRDVRIEVKRCAECGARFGIDAAFCPFDGVQLSIATWDKTGDPRARIKVDGRYEVLEPLGEGGMGTVYRVRHLTLGRAFAMKVLRRDLALDADLARRFVQEARATAAIKHPAVVGITDFGTLEDGSPYFVMELLEGETLATRIRARGPMPPKTASLIARQIADGLSASHAAHVIHRDLKPENIFLVGARSGKTAEEAIRIVDFGAAKIIGGSKLTRPGIVFGTPYYMSPEQAGGQPVDGRADVYSLGVLLYEMITGRVPFEADTYMGVLTKHMFETPGRPTAGAGVPLGELETVVMRALEKDPKDRYDSMAALSTALAGLSKQASVTLKQIEAPASQPTLRMGTAPIADRLGRSVERQVRAESRRTARLVAIAVLSTVATVGIAAGAFSFATRSKSPEPRASTAVSARPVPEAQSAAPTPSAPAAPIVSEAPPAPSAPPASSVAAKRQPPPPVPTAAVPPTSPRPPTSARPASASSAHAPGSGGDEFRDPWAR